MKLKSIPQVNFNFPSGINGYIIIVVKYNFNNYIFILNKY